jgi:hypothetical protein
MEEIVINGEKYFAEVVVEKDIQVILPVSAHYEMNKLQHTSQIFDVEYADSYFPACTIKEIITKESPEFITEHPVYITTIIKFQ